MEILKVFFRRRARLARLQAKLDAERLHRRLAPALPPGDHASRKLQSDAKYSPDWNFYLGFHSIRNPHRLMLLSTNLLTRQ